MTDFQQILYHTLKYFHNFCATHDITYYAHGGTCLGAVRHKGFIPWDDDLDVLMPRSDYNRFLSLAEEYNKAGYKIAHIEDGQHLMWVPFAKFYPTTCTVWQRRKFPLIYAPWIDIFPMDNECENQPHDQLNEDIKETLWHYHKCIARHPWREIRKNLTSEKWVNGILKIIKTTYYRAQRPLYYSRLRQQLKTAQSIEGGGSYRTYGWTSNRVYDKKWFGKPMQLEFEDMVINVPQDYDAFLRFLFDDYMQIPPIEQQVSKHEYFYINLKERKSIAEIEAEIGVDDPRESVIRISDAIDTLKHMIRSK